MIWLLIGPIVFVAVLWSFVKDFRDIGFDVGMWFACFFISIMFGCVGAFGGIIIAAIIGNFLDTHPMKVWEHALVSIRDKDSVSGSFFLGSGSIEGSVYYFYYEQNADGSFVPGKIRANRDVRIFEETRTDATIAKFREDFNNRTAYFFAVPSISVTYEFHVPTGTIRRGFTM